MNLELRLDGTAENAHKSKDIANTLQVFCRNAYIVSNFCAEMEILKSRIEAFQYSVAVCALGSLVGPSS